MPAKKNVNINLIYKEEDVSFSNQVLNWALTYGRYIIIITQIIVLSVFFLRFKYDRDNSDLKELVTQKQSLVESVGELEKEIRHIQTRLGYVKTITGNQNNILKIITYLQNITPVDITLASLNVNPTRISFDATSKNLRTFSFFLGKLQQDNKLIEVTLDEINRRPDGKIQFKIKADLNPKVFI